MNPLTHQQQIVLGYIIAVRSNKGYSPTTREIAKHFGWVQTAAVNHIRALEKKGAITTQRGQARTIVPTL